MNRIVAFGCSNTQGMALPDLPTDSAKVSKYAWPSVLAKNLGFDVWNRAHGGASNKFILYRLLETEFKKTDTVIILWTAFNRSCFIDEGKVIRMLPSDINRPVERNKESRRQHSAYYYEHLDSDYNGWFDSMVQINLAKAHLDSLGLKNLHLTWCEDPMADVRPMWNKVDLINKKFSKVDFALDNDHPGVQSQKLMAEFIQEQLKF